MSSTKDALLRFSEKVCKDTDKMSGQVSKKTYGKPEKEVEKAVLRACDDVKIDINVVESKAVYSVHAGRYLRGQAAPGFSDLVGNTCFGTAVYIELKAKGKRANLSDAQREFLKRKITTECFACVTDSEEHFLSLYSRWANLFSKDRAQAVKLLNDSLPKERASRRGPDPWD